MASSSLAPAPQVDTEVADSTAPATTMYITPSDSSRLVTYPFYATLSMNSPTIHLSMKTDFGKSTMFALFESVRLLDLEFTIYLNAGVTKSVLYAIVATETEPSDYMNAPIMGITPGAAYGSSVVTVALPKPHSFGAELKAIALGNPPPSVFVKYTGGAPSDKANDVLIRGHVKLIASGHGIISAKRIT